MSNLAAWLRSDSVPASFADRRLANSFLKYWEELRGRRRLPPISELSFDSIQEFMPHTFNMDLGAGAQDPIVRYMGKDLAADCGGNYTNKRVSELPPQSLLARATRRVAEVIATGEPVMISDRFVTGDGNEILYRAVMLPFAGESDRIDNVVGALNCKVVPFAAAATGPRRETRAIAESAGHRPPIPAAPAASSFKARCMPPPGSPVRDGTAPAVPMIEKARSGDRVSESPPATVAGSAATVKSRAGRVIVVGSAKGGTGKSTAAMHLIVSMLREGLKVGSIDLDTPQQTLSRYIENRRAPARHRARALPVPNHLAFPEPDVDKRRLEDDLRKLLATCDAVVIDTPGSDTELSRWAHALADTVITPINDSFVDLDTLAVLDPETHEVLQWGHYAEMVARAREQKARLTGHVFDWIVIRNRLTNLNAGNKQRMADTLQALSASLGFRNEPGLGERVIYRELFLEGLTLLDLVQEEIEVTLTMSHVAARQELRTLLNAIGQDAPAPTRRP